MGKLQVVILEGDQERRDVAGLMRGVRPLPCIGAAFSTISWLTANWPC